jgi:hypothetical protein
MLKRDRRTFTSAVGGGASAVRTCTPPYSCKGGGTSPGVQMVGGRTSYKTAGTTTGGRVTTDAPVPWADDEGPDIDDASENAVPMEIRA